MKRTCAYSLCLLGVLVLFSGCANVQVATNINELSLADSRSDNVAHVQATIKGVYFLGKKPLLIPKIEGAPEDVAADPASIPSLVYVLSSVAKEQGATKVIDMQTSAKNSMMWLPIPFIFSMKTVTGSANGVK